MKKYGWISGAFFIALLLVIIEMTIISNASGYEVKEKAVFAKVRISRNTVITGDMLEIKEIGAGSVHPNALRDMENAVSKRAGMDIEAGEMLLGSKLLSGEGGIIEAEDHSKRLFCVEFETDRANGWQLSDGQNVDIIYVPNHGELKDEPPLANGVETVSPASSGVKVLKNIRIAGLIDEDARVTDRTEAEKTPKYVCFEVTVEQAAFLAFAKSNGRLEISSVPAQ